MSEEKLYGQIVDKLLAQNDKMLAREEKDLRWRKQRFFMIFMFFLLGGIVYVQAFVSVFGGNVDDKSDEDYAAMVTINGAIMPGQKNSAYNVIMGLDDAFLDENAKGIVLYINSPGGTPVQAALIADHIKRLRSEHPEKVIVTVAEDLIASGGYMAAMGTDEIYVHRSTIAGSIGVVSEGFGYQGIIEKISLERRVHTAGLNKRRLDPYFPLVQEDVDVINERLKKIHAQFIALVKESRGDKLKASDEVLFNGDVWTGAEALALGLVDGLSDLDGVIRDRFGVKYVKDVSIKPSIFDRFASSFKRQVSVMFMEAAYEKPSVMTMY